MGGFEPHILAGPGIDGNIWYYYDSPSGLVSKGTEYPENQHIPGNLWVSKDLGYTWEYKQKTVLEGIYSPGGSGDTFTAISQNGAIYHTDLYLSSASVDTSLDGGDNWILNTVATWFNPTNGFIVDRQWLDIGPTIGGGEGDQTLYFSYNHLAEGLVMISADVTDQADVAALWTACNGAQGGGPITTDVAARDNHAVDELNGTIYITNYASGRSQIEVWRSTDGCFSFDGPFLVKETASRAEAQNIFTVIDTDIAGNIYVTWSSRDQMWLAVSTDMAETWTIHQVTTSHAVKTLPWVTAGDEGRVAMAWYEAEEGTDGGSDDKHDSWWDLKVATSFNAHNETPVFDIYTVEAAVHLGGIQTTGTGGGSDRDLGDFLTVDIDPFGRLLIAYGNDAQDNGTNDSRMSHPMFAGQLDGPFFRVGKGPQMNVTHSQVENEVRLRFESLWDPDFAITNITIYGHDDWPGLKVDDQNSSYSILYSDRDGTYNLTIQATNEIGMRSTLVIPITIKAEDEGWTIAGMPAWAVLGSGLLLLLAVGAVAASGAAGGLAAAFRKGDAGAKKEQIAKGQDKMKGLKEEQDIVLEAEQ